MIDPNLILDKLKIDKLTGINNILKDEQLCNRIIQEEPVSIQSFLKEKIIPETHLKKLIGGRLISCFSNSENQGSKKFIFRNEIRLFLDKGFIYDKSIIVYLRDANEFIISVLEDSLTQEQCDVFKVYLLEFGDPIAVEAFAKKYGRSLNNTKNVFLRTFLEIKRRKSIYDSFVKDLTIERDKLIEEVEVLRKLKASLYKRITPLKEKAKANYSIQDLRILGSDLFLLDFPLRANNILHKIGVNTVQELLEIPISELAKLEGMGVTSIKEMEQELANYNLHLRDG